MGYLDLSGLSEITNKNRRELVIFWSLQYWLILWHIKETLYFDTSHTQSQNEAPKWGYGLSGENKRVCFKKGLDSDISQLNSKNMVYITQKT